MRLRVVLVVVVLVFVSVQLFAQGPEKAKDVNVVNTPTVDAIVVNEPTVQIGNDAASPIPVTVVDGGSAQQLYQSTHAASIGPDVTGGGTAFTIEIDDIPDDMRLVVESVSLSLLECNVGLMQHAHIRDYSSNTYMMLPLLNNSRSATYGICGDPPGSSFDAFYQSNHFSTKFYLANHITLGGPDIVIWVDQDLEPISYGTFFVTLAGYLESLTSP